MSNGEPDTLVDVQEAARILSLKPATVYALAQSRRLEPVHPAGLRAVRFRRSEVETLAGLRPAAPVAV